VLFCFYGEFCDPSAPASSGQAEARNRLVTFVARAPPPAKEFYPPKRSGSISRFGNAGSP